MEFEKTDPPVGYYHDGTCIYVVDDYGFLVRVPSRLWYGDNPSLM